MTPTPRPTRFAESLFEIELTIADGESLSNAVILNGLAPVRITTDFTGTLTFQEADEIDDTFEDVYDENTEVSLSVTDGKRERLINPERWVGIGCLKVRSGTADTPVAMSGAAGTIKMVLREL